MKHLVIILCLLVAFAPSLADSKDRSKKENDEEKKNFVKIIVFGDSLVTGYGLDKEHSFIKVLERKFKSENNEHIKVLDGTFTGLTSELALERLQVVLDFKPDIVILALGSNDAFSKQLPQKTYTNLSYIIQTLKKERIKILLTGVKLPKGAHPQYQEKFQSMYEYLADQYDLKLYPNLLKNISGNRDLTLSDLVHPNKIGMETMVNNIYPLLELILFRQYKDIILQHKRQELLKKESGR